MKIVITIDKEGGVSSKVEGVKGAACTKADAFLLGLAGQREEKKTAEYYEAEKTTNATNGRA